jgi:hypothetical protein
MQVWKIGNTATSLILQGFVALFGWQHSGNGWQHVAPF